MLATLLFPAHGDFGRAGIHGHRAYIRDKRNGFSQPRSQHCLSTVLAQGVSFSILIGCNLNDESVRKILKTQLRYEISNGFAVAIDEGSGNCAAVHTKTTLGQRNV